MNVFGFKKLLQHDLQETDGVFGPCKMLQIFISLKLKKTKAFKNQQQGTTSELRIQSLHISR
jgi:hypothetical protein